MGRRESLHPEATENDEIRQEYNSLNGRFIIKCAPRAAHESFSQFFFRTLFPMPFQDPFVRARGSSPPDWARLSPAGPS